MRLAIRAAAIQPRASSSHSISNPAFSQSVESNTSLPFNNSMLSWSQLKPNSAKCKFPKLGHKWKQYQGINHWEGLLDPLDDNLRWEILKYGHFVDAAYRSFDFDSSSPTYATCRYPKSSLLRRCGMVDCGYRLTKNLRATCGVHVPAWIDNMSMWACTQSSWIGYVAICEHKNEITRLGRRDVVIAFRGTATCFEWLENLRTTLTYLPDLVEGKDGVGPMVEKGFLSLYTSKTTTRGSLQDMVREEIGRVIQSYRNEPLSLTLTGHSLGAALAILSAYDITATFENAPMVTVVSFGGPRVGNKSFRRQLEQGGIKILRIVNPDDVFTRVPGFVVSNDDMESKDNVHMESLLGWLHRRVEDMQLVYVDVGQELRLSSKKLPYMKKGNVAMCHDLKTYLYLVKSFMLDNDEANDEEKLLQSENEIIRREKFEAILNLQKENSGLIEPKRDLVIVPGMYIPQPVAMPSSTPAKESDEQQEGDPAAVVSGKHDSGNSNGPSSSGHRNFGARRQRASNHHSSSTVRNSRKPVQQWVKRDNPSRKQ